MASESDRMLAPFSYFSFRSAASLSRAAPVTRVPALCAVFAVFVIIHFLYYWHYHGVVVAGITWLARVSPRVPRWIRVVDHRVS